MLDGFLVLTWAFSYFMGLPLTWLCCVWRTSSLVHHEHGVCARAAKACGLCPHRVIPLYTANFAGTCHAFSEKVGLQSLSSEPPVGVVELRLYHLYLHDTRPRRPSCTQQKAHGLRESVAPAQCTRVDCEMEASRWQE